MPDHPVLQLYKPTEYYVESVLSYTSKYNNRSSIGYAPENLVGKPMKYPYYGDFPDTYMLRSYGTWWHESEASQPQYMTQDQDPYGAEDYIVLRFESGVIPKHVFIYETYNPGAVVRIWGRYTGASWNILWEGPPQIYPPTSRKFDPPIRETYTVVNEIRLDFNQSHLKYHTALDAIVLVGYSPQVQIRMFADSSPVEKVEKLETISDEDDCELNKVDMFAQLPHEVMLHIFQYLDLKSLCRSAQVCRKWYQTSLDSTLYHELSLKRYWHKVDDKLLMTYFVPRCHGLRKLDLSWCGNDNSLREETFVIFLRNCCQHLTHLSLGNCGFARNIVLDEITQCQEMTDLRLRGMQADVFKFSVLSYLNKLTTLDLYSSTIVDEALIPILKSNPCLKHLIIDLCENLERLDQVAETVAEFNRNLVSWSSWKTSSITSIGVKYLTNCPYLRELDLGWCLILSDPGDCLESIAVGCKDLRRLIISGWRGINDQLILPVIKNCRYLTQLDLLGIKNITAETCENAFAYLSYLRLLEISFCDGIKLEQVIVWRERYPYITIQRSCEYVVRDYWN